MHDHLISQETTIMSDIELQSLIVNKLTELAVGQASLVTDMAAVKTHLEKLNGKVAAHEKELAERRHQCPLVDEMERRVRSIEDQNTSRNAVDQNNSSWLNRLWPFIWASIGIFGVLTLQNAPAILKMVGK
jgi:hypothetical protein